MAFDAFGPGIMIVTRTDIANSTPVNVGFAQKLDVKFAATEVELHGQSVYALDAARGKTKVTCSAESSLISGRAWNDTFFGNSFTSGGVKWNPSEVATIPATPFQVTVANAATYEAGPPDGDLGVIFDAVPNLPLIRVASAPATGQYSINTATGVYTFAPADTGKKVQITYRSTTTAGQTLNVNNITLGTEPIFQMDYRTIRNNKEMVVRMFQCHASDIEMSVGLELFLQPKWSFMLSTLGSSPTAPLLSWYFPEVS